jgi:hypothetical protein
VIHRDSGNRGELQRMIDAAQPFVIAKDKELVLPDGTTDSGAELVLVEGKGTVERLKEADRVEDRVAVVLPEVSRVTG